MSKTRFRAFNRVIPHVKIINGIIETEDRQLIRQLKNNAHFEEVETKCQAI